MYTDKIQIIENEVQEIKEGIKIAKKEIKKREKLLSMVNDEDLEVEMLEYKEKIENLTKLLKTKKQIIKNYKKL